MATGWNKSVAHFNAPRNAWIMSDSPVGRLVLLCYVSSRGLFVRLKIAEKSIFAVLMRSPWWISILLATAIALAGQFIVSDKFTIIVTSLSFPFFIIAVIAAWNQRHKPGSARIARTMDAVMAMPWREFSDLLEQGFQREGYVVVRTSGAADFELTKAGRTVLVCGRRWKAASHGLEPLRELVNERDTKEAREVRYICIKGITDNAYDYAKDNKIVLMQGMELTELLRLSKGI
ncbi:MAG: restriction endonuclease [Betaproteobacteria bacterium]